MHFFHQWSPWSEPYDQPVELVRRGVVIKTYTAAYQRRTCLKCGKIQDREI